jgi:hypothetical protein
MGNLGPQTSNILEFHNIVHVAVYTSRPEDLRLIHTGDVPKHNFINFWSPLILLSGCSDSTSTK